MATVVPSEERETLCRYYHRRFAVDVLAQLHPTHHAASIVVRGSFIVIVQLRCPCIQRFRTHHRYHPHLYLSHNYHRSCNQIRLLTPRNHTFLLQNQNLRTPRIHLVEARAIILSYRRVVVTGLRVCATRTRTKFTRVIGCYCRRGVIIACKLIHTPCAGLVLTRDIAKSSLWIEITRLLIHTSCA